MAERNLIRSMELCITIGMNNAKCLMSLAQYPVCSQVMDPIHPTPTSSPCNSTAITNITSPCDISLSTVCILMLHKCCRVFCYIFYLNRSHSFYIYPRHAFNAASAPMGTYEHIWLQLYHRSSKNIRFVFVIFRTNEYTPLADYKRRGDSMCVLFRCKSSMI